jgi:hypothetical protein
MERESGSVGYTQEFARVHGAIRRSAPAFEVGSFDMSVCMYSESDKTSDECLSTVLQSCDS